MQNKEKLMHTLDNASHALNQIEHHIEIIKDPKSLRRTLLHQNKLLEVAMRPSRKANMHDMLEQKHVTDRDRWEMFSKLVSDGPKMSLNALITQTLRACAYGGASLHGLIKTEIVPIKDIVGDPRWFGVKSLRKKHHLMMRMIKLSNGPTAQYRYDYLV